MTDAPRKPPQRHPSTMIPAETVEPKIVTISLTRPQAVNILVGLQQENERVAAAMSNARLAERLTDILCSESELS